MFITKFCYWSCLQMRITKRVRKEQVVVEYNVERIQLKKNHAQTLVS